jgi:hypothetical protein
MKCSWIDVNEWRISVKKPCGKNSWGKERQMLRGARILHKDAKHYPTNNKPENTWRCTPIR